MPSLPAGEGYTGARNKLTWERGCLLKRRIRGENPSSGGCAATFPRKGGRYFLGYTGVKNGSGAPSVGLNTTFTFWPIFSLSMSQSTKFVCNDGPSFSVT